jgi:hypothetical protein
VKRLSLRTTFCLFAILTVFIVLAPSAAACCTAIVCPYCVSGRSDCVCGPQQPVCNVAGCNCNVQCGEWTYNTNNTCYFSPTCGSSATAQERFNTADANHDGKISKAEVETFVAAQDHWMKNINHKHLPKNLQGKNVTAKQIADYGFQQMDKNHDGSVSPAEFDKDLAKASSIKPSAAAPAASK